MSLQGYSDRINHAFAFTAKHHPARVSRNDPHSCLIRTSNVAVILARHGADEATIVASVLKLLVEESGPARLDTLQGEIIRKFGTMVWQAVDQASEPRYDRFGRERSWKACKMDYLAKLTRAEPRVLDVCAATEIHLSGSALADLRRLGAEYLETIGPASTEQTLWWHGTLLEMLEHHATWTRPPMLHEFQTLAAQLAAHLEGI